MEIVVIHNRNFICNYPGLHKFPEMEIFSETVTETIESSFLTKFSICLNCKIRQNLKNSSKIENFVKNTMLPDSVVLFPKIFSNFQETEIEKFSKFLVQLCNYLDNCITI